MSMANTITSFDIASASSVAQLVLSILGIVYLAVKITNETLNGRVDREGHGHELFKNRRGARI